VGCSSQPRPGHDGPTSGFDTTVGQGIDSISVTPDSFVAIGEQVAQVERDRSSGRAGPTFGTVARTMETVQGVAHHHNMTTQTKVRSVVEPSPVPPRAVAMAARLWVVAIAAGLFETALVVVQGEEPGAQLVVGIAVRLAVFAVMSAVVLAMRRGARWARAVLAVGLGVLGSLSMVIGPIEWLAAGNTFADLREAVALGSLLFAASRAAHLGAVWAATVLMYRAPARRWFSPRDVSTGETPAGRPGI
jgi:hypothetical protein